MGYTASTCQVGLAGVASAAGPGGAGEMTRTFGPGDCRGIRQYEGMGVTRANLATRPERPSPRPDSPRRVRARRLLVRVELLSGGSALLCGGLLAVRPDGSLLGLPTSVLVD